MGNWNYMVIIESEDKRNGNAEFFEHKKDAEEYKSDFFRNGWYNRIVFQLTGAGNYELIEKDKYYVEPRCNWIIATCYSTGGRADFIRGFWTIDEVKNAMMSCIDDDICNEREVGNWIDNISDIEEIYDGSLYARAAYENGYIYYTAIRETEIYQEGGEDDNAL